MTFIIDTVEVDLIEIVDVVEDVFEIKGEDNIEIGVNKCLEIKEDKVFDFNIEIVVL